MANVYFEVQANGQKLGRIEFRLYDNIVPKTAKNFRELATGVHGFGYQGTSFNRIVPDFLVQGGDVDGKGGKSIYGKYFEDENFHIKHSKDGLLSMASHGPDTNGSQFCITTTDSEWLDGKCVAFGEVIHGRDVVKAIEKLGSQNGKPQTKVVIAKCGTV